jgi:diguanylate cyclase (GGDEF)-like protein/PAS domain S-box-containing protein
MPALLNPEIFRTVLERLQTGVYLVDTDRRIVFWSDGAERITGYLRHQVLGHFCRENVLMYCDGKSCGLCGSVCPLSEAMQEGRPKEARIYFRHKLGHQIPVYLRVVPIRDDRGSVIGAAESFDEQVADSRDDDLAPYGCLDAATGVPNHDFTQSHLRESLATYREYRVPFSILNIHVDRLEHVQATHGREAAAFILRATAGTIKNVLGPGAFVGRWKENEFLAVMTAWNPTQVEKAVENIQKIVSCSSIKWWDDQLFVHVTMGHTAVRPDDSIEFLVERVSVLRRHHSIQGDGVAKAIGLGL